jgi:hypothetical protein
LFFDVHSTDVSRLIKHRFDKIFQTDIVCLFDSFGIWRTFFISIGNNNFDVFISKVVGAGGLIPGSLTPPDKVVGASGGLSGGHLLNQQQQQQQQNNIIITLTPWRIPVRPWLRLCRLRRRLFRLCRHPCPSIDTGYDTSSSLVIIILPSAD